MTIEQFLAELKSKSYLNFDLVDYMGGKAIRTKNNSCLCPVVAVETKGCADKAYNCLVFESGRKLGLSDKDTSKLINASDSATKPENLPLRKQLLEAVGLQ